MSGDEVAKAVRAAAVRKGIPLNRNQLEVVTAILNSTERVVGLQGGAGNGKTTALSVLKDLADEAGYKIRGYAPTTKAAANLAQSGLQTQTLQMFLRSRREIPTGQATLFVIDEASLVSTKNLHEFFKRIGDRDRVILVGDKRQHQSIEAGRAFEQLQQHGMETAKLVRNVRQPNPALKEINVKLSTLRVREAVREMMDQGRVVEIPEEKRRMSIIAAEYCRRPEGALVISLRTGNGSN